MSRTKNALGVGLLFAAGTAGVHIYGEVVDNRERDDIRACYAELDGTEAENCVNEVNDGNEGILTWVAIAGAIGTIATGYELYRTVRDEREKP